MTYVVADNCIKCKYMDCVEVCPVDCFYEGENMLVIHPDECIDCGVCEPECPAEAIKPDTEPRPRQVAEAQRRIRQDLAQHHRQADAPADAKEHDGEDGQVREVLLARARRGRLSPIGRRRLRPAVPRNPTPAQSAALGARLLILAKLCYAISE